MNPNPPEFTSSHIIGASVEGESPLRYTMSMKCCLSASVRFMVTFTAPSLKSPPSPLPSAALLRWTSLAEGGGGDGGGGGSEAIMRLDDTSAHHRRAAVEPPSSHLSPVSRPSISSRRSWASNLLGHQEKCVRVCGDPYPTNVCSGAGSVDIRRSAGVNIPQADLALIRPCKALQSPN